MVLLCSLVSFHLYGSDGTKSLFDVLHYQEVVKVDIESDFEYFINNRRSEEKQDASFKFKNSRGSEIALDANISIRGKYRRMFSKGIPPLKIDFKKKDLAALGLKE